MPTKQRAAPAPAVRRSSRAKSAEVKTEPETPASPPTSKSAKSKQNSKTPVTPVRRTGRRRVKTESTSESIAEVEELQEEEQAATSSAASTPVVAPPTRKKAKPNKQPTPAAVKPEKTENVKDEQPPAKRTSSPQQSEQSRKQQQMKRKEASLRGVFAQVMGRVQEAAADDAVNDGLDTLTYHFNKIQDSADMLLYTHVFIDTVSAFLCADARNAFADRAIEFLAAAAVTLRHVPPLRRADDEYRVKFEEKNGKMGVLTTLLLKKLVKPNDRQEINDTKSGWYQNQDDGVRFRCCQLINRLLKHISEKLEMYYDEHLFPSVEKALMRRLRDKKNKVKEEAIDAIRWLQVDSGGDQEGRQQGGKLYSEDDDENVSETLQFVFRTDTTATIRAKALRAFVLKRDALPDIIVRTRDISDQVRFEAYKQLAVNVSPMLYNIDERLELLRNGLGEQCPRVRAVVVDKLIPGWLESCERHVDRLDKGTKKRGDDEEPFVMDESTKTRARLRLLDILWVYQKAEADGVPESLTRVLVESDVHEKGLEHTIDKFDLLDQKLVPHEPLTPVRAYYWRVFVECAFRLAEDKAALLQYAQDNLLPKLRPLTRYVKKYVNEMIDGAKATQKEAAAGSSRAASASVNKAECYKAEFVGRQLLQLLPYASAGDTGDRTEWLKYLKGLLTDEGLSNKLIEPVMVQLCKVQMSLTAEQSQLANAPRGVVDDAFNVSLNSSTASQQPQPARQTSADSHTTRSTANDVSACVLGIVNELLPVGDQEDEPTHLDESVEDLFEDAHEEPTTLSATQDAAGMLSRLRPDDVDRRKRERMQKLPYALVVKCLSLIVALLRRSCIQTNSDPLRMLLNEIVEPCVYHTHPGVRTLRFEAIGLYGLLDVGVVNEHIKLIWQAMQVDVPSVRLQATEVLFDWLLQWGVQPLAVQLPTAVINAAERAELGAHNVKPDVDKSVNAMLDVLIKLMNHRDAPDAHSVAVCAGLCKLLLNDRIQSVSVLTELLLLWNTTDVSVSRSGGDVSAAQDDQGADRLDQSAATNRNQQLQLLGAFFQHFPLKSPKSQELMGQVFMPTVRRVLNAKKHSALQSLDKDTIAKTIIKITDQSKLPDGKF